MKIIKNFTNFQDVWLTLDVGDIIEIKFETLNKKYFILKKISLDNFTFTVFVFTNKDWNSQNKFREARFDKTYIKDMKIIKV